MNPKRRRMTIRVSWIVMATVIVFSMGIGNTFAKQCDNQFPTVVKTKYGIVEGYYNTDVTVAWTGVPFAKPPVGDLRWKAPQDPEPWPGVLNATEPCMPCLQLKFADNWERAQSTEGSSEDCLYLSIYRPIHRLRNLPVYVFFHGGSNHFGSASNFNGSAIAAKSNLVVVIAQQRLGPMGWFAHPALRHGESMADDSGNFGTLDNIKLLEWIQKNIRAFGGDPRKVTITGESAGAHNVMNLVISPLARGLFHGAMSQSGGMTTEPMEEGVAKAEDIIDKILATEDIAITREQWDAMPLNEQEAFLRGLDGSLIWTSLYPLAEGDAFFAFRDGHVITDSVVATIRSGDYNKVPIILGANESEIKIFLPMTASQAGTNWDQLIDVLDGEKTLEEVFRTDWEQHIYNITGYYGSRNWCAKFVDERARALKEQQGHVYAYHFRWGEPGSGPTPYDIIFGAAHATDIPFFFGGSSGLFGYGFNPENDTAGRRALTNAMMTYLGNFAYTGNPNGLPFWWWKLLHNQQKSELSNWREWSNEPEGPKTMVFDADFDQAILGMSNEEVDILEEMAKLEAELSTWPPELQVYGPQIQAFQLFMPE